MNRTALLVLLGILCGLVAFAYTRGGTALVSKGFGQGGRLLLEVGLLLVVSFLAAGFAQVLVPKEWVAGALGERSGFSGILFASAAGAAMPGGPYVALPIAATLAVRGAATGPVVAFVTAWSLLAVHRLIAWEIPILGARFALIRYAACLVLPVAAGMIARLLTRS